MTKQTPFELIRSGFWMGAGFALINVIIKTIDLLAQLTYIYLIQ